MPTLRARPPPPPPAPSTSRPPPPPPVLVDPVPPPSEAVLALRRDWKFAAVCQFVFTFEEALQLGGEFETEEFEDDLTLGTHKIINKLMQKMLVILTYDRRITEDDWERFLRTQFERRQPEEPLLGTDEEPVAWSDLSPERRLEAIHTLSEWLFINPNNLRRKMKDEESAYLWRIEPIGYDSKQNAYWLFDDNRLWIQRAPPKPKVSHKKKERPPPPPKEPPKKKQKLSSAAAARSTPAPAAAAVKGKAKVEAKKEEEQKPNGRYPRRSAASKPPPPPSPSKSPARPRVMGIRQSSRLRGREEEEVWQEIPEEWLAPENEDVKMADGADEKAKVNGNGSGRKRPLEEDGDSELTDLSDDEGEEKPAKAEDGDVDMPDTAGDETLVKDEAPSSGPSSSLSSPPATPPPPPRTINGIPVPPDFIEWETIAVTLFQWEHIAEQFSKSTNKAERAFYNLLVEDVVPRVLAELKEIEKLRKKEELLATRKRSSRLQMKELEAEQRRLEEEKRAEEEALNARNKRAEERERRAEAERLERERKAREREERALRREREAWQPTASVTPGAASGGEENRHTGGGEDSSTAVEETSADAAAHVPRRAPKDEEKWELDCEICGKKGWNVDDGSKMACCEVCGKWQHTACHDAADAKAGRPKRRWALVQFKCKECRNRHRRELYAKRQQAQKQKEEEERAAALAAGLPMPNQQQKNGDLKVHLTIPKVPAVLKQPGVNGASLSPTTATSSRPPVPPAANRVSSSPKVTTANGQTAAFGQPASPNYPIARQPLPSLDRRTSGSHSPSVPTASPYSGFPPGTSSYTLPQHATYQSQFNAYSPTVAYPASHTAAQSPHTVQPSQVAQQSSQSPPSGLGAAHRSPPVPPQTSPNPQQQAFPFPYAAAYGTQGYAYGFNRGTAAPAANATATAAPYAAAQVQAFYQTYYQAVDPRYSYPPGAYAGATAGTKQAQPGPSANAALPSQSLSHVSPVVNGHISPPATATERSPMARPSSSDASRVPLLPPAIVTAGAPPYPPQPPVPVQAPPTASAQGRTEATL